MDSSLQYISAKERQEIETKIKIKFNIETKVEKRKFS